MLKALLARAHQGHRTLAYPDGPTPALPERFRGLPTIDSSRCPAGCGDCAAACPTEAISIGPPSSPGRAQDVSINLGRCLFCPECERACPERAIAYTNDHRLSSRTREGLVAGDARQIELARALDDRLMRLYGRSLKLRVVSAGGCNGCESDVNVLSTVVWDIGRFGIQVVASPRHADGLLVTGPVTENMRLALRKTYDAIPDPKIVIAVGACAIAGGPYLTSPAQHRGADSTVPVDLYIAGCPPHPLTILDGLLRLLGRIEGKK
jgi:Ni,Fe-hydrogenase III small subunit/formate hydrogenlyase subunit 6/NADH:ubiquinone oxidoreductase subunit I